MRGDLGREPGLSSSHAWMNPSTSEASQQAARRGRHPLGGYVGKPQSHVEAQTQAGAVTCLGRAVPYEECSRSNYGAAGTGFVSRRVPVRASGSADQIASVPAPSCIRRRAGASGRVVDRRDVKAGMAEDRYRLSFTTGGLLVRESAVAVPLYQRLGEWTAVRAAIESENLLQARTVSSGRRLAREVVQRLAELTDDEIDLLRDGTTVERGYLMWVAACRRYGLLGEFAEEVVRERFLLLAPAIGHADFDSFIRSKAMWHEELAELKESTYRKLRSNVFLMLHEVGVLDDAGNITPAVLTDRLTAALGERSPSDVRFLPTNEPVTSRSGR